ncbi:MAG: GDP-L-fucose synthase [Pseudomonadota bacterium]
MYSLAGKRIWVAGHKGMVGSAVVRQLEAAAKECEIITADRTIVDLTRQEQVADFMADTKPDGIIMAAAKVGGILANETRPADFLHDNLSIISNIAEASHATGVEKLLFLGSSCIYPKFAPQPISEDALLTGPLEPTNEWYAIAKIAGIKLMQAYRKQHGHDYISAMPTNLYGTGDNFDLNSSHVLPALMRKVHEAKVNGADEITVWGSGTPKREFLHADDCARALIFLMENYSDEQHVNVGFGKDIAILELAQLMCEIISFEGKITLDRTKADGTPRKLMDNSKLASMGWQPEISLQQGIAQTYEWFRANVASQEHQA